MSTQIIGPIQREQIERAKLAKARIYGKPKVCAQPVQSKQIEHLKQELASLREKVKSAYSTAENRYATEVRTVQAENLELKGMLKAIRAGLSKRGFGDLVDEILAGLDFANASYPAGTIMNAVSVASNVLPRDRHSEKRLKYIVYWRHIEMYLLKKHTAHSYPSIGRLVGDRDHSTVMHGVRKVEDDYERYAADILKVEGLL